MGATAAATGVFVPLLTVIKCSLAYCFLNVYLIIKLLHLLV